MDLQNSTPLDLQAILGTGFQEDLAGKLSPGELTDPILAEVEATQAIRAEHMPPQLKSLQDAGLQKNDVFPLVLKFLFLHGNQSGAAMSRQLKVPYALLEPVLAALKADMLIGPKQSAGAGDFEYELSAKGIEKARMHLSRSTYCGAAPVSLAEYKTSIVRQSIRNLKPTFESVAESLSDMVVSELTVSQLGQALNSGRAMFLFGAPGNGKTSIATRAIRALSETIWIPRALTVGGEVIRLYDPLVHETAPLPQSQGIMSEHDVDERWIRIKRPTIVVGGELEMKHLDATLNPVTGIIEAPIHVKSNCGCLVVDDFGRQQVSSRELLNRWIVPMESGTDFVNLPSGRQIAVPFEQLLIFSTNLEPADLCDEAFLRRIPYKVEMFDPSETQFRELFEIKSRQMGFEIEPGVIDSLIEYHYKRVGRPFRFCHPEDLLSQARDFCEFHRQPLVFRKDIAELAVLNYFSGMEGQLTV